MAMRCCGKNLGIFLTIGRQKVLLGYVLGVERVTTVTSGDGGQLGYRICEPERVTSSMHDRRCKNTPIVKIRAL